MRLRPLPSALCPLLLLLSGCALVRPAPAPLANADRLMRAPGFVAAAQAAPAWVGDALKTINRLEHEVQRTP